ncbi:MAG TPA: hypothetical protein VGT04_00190 [Acidobacteriaceae bacterium]|nr:hypothetical protein [Acidobacteriaceae bacterium]
MGAVLDRTAPYASPASQELATPTDASFLKSEQLHPKTAFTKSKNGFMNSIGWPKDSADRRHIFCTRESASAQFFEYFRAFWHQKRRNLKMHAIAFAGGAASPAIPFMENFLSVEG